MTKHALVAMLLVLVLGSATVFATNYGYYFNLEIDNLTADSGVVTKNTVAPNGAYLQQTGSSPGTYTVTYNVMSTSTISVTNPLTISGTNYAENYITYKGGYAESYLHVSFLRARYNGQSIHTVSGVWNPNGKR